MRSLGRWFAQDLSRVGFAASLVLAAVIACMALVEFWWVRLVVFLLIARLSFAAGIFSDWYPHLIVGRAIMAMFTVLGYVVLLVFVAIYMILMIAVITIWEGIQEQWYAFRHDGYCPPFQFY